MPGTSALWIFCDGEVSVCEFTSLEALCHLTGQHTTCCRLAPTEQGCWRYVCRECWFWGFLLNWAGYVKGIDKRRQNPWLQVYWMWSHEKVPQKFPFHSINDISKLPYKELIKAFSSNKYMQIPSQYSMNRDKIKDMVTQSINRQANTMYILWWETWGWVGLFPQDVIKLGIKTEYWTLFQNSFLYSTETDRKCHNPAT